MKVIKQILTIVIFVLMGWYLLKIDDWDKIKSISYGNIGTLLFLYFLFYFFISPPIKLISKDLGFKIPLPDILGISILTNFMNYILPVRGGVVLRGFYLKKRYALGLKQYTAISIVISLVGLIVTGFSNGVAFLMNPDSVDKLKGLHALVFVILTGGGLVLIFSPVLLMKISKKIRELKETIDWPQISSHRNILVTFVFYSLALVVYIFRFHILCNSMDITISGNQLISLVTLSLVVNLLPILPGNVGVKEASFAGVFHLLGYNYEIGALISIVDRFLQIGFLFGVSLVYSLKTDVIKLLKESKTENSI